MPAPKRSTWTAALTAGALLAAAPAIADSPAKAPQSSSSRPLDTITVKAQRERKVLEHRVDKFVYGITLTPFEDSVAQWQKATPICPLVAGLPQDDGEYMFSRLSQIAAAAGAALGPANCQPNFFVIVTSVPNELLKALNKRNRFMFGGGYPTKVRRFMTAPTPVRVWYNVRLTDRDGNPCMPACSDDAHIAYGSVRDLSSVIVMVDARQTKGISFGQLAAYVALNGLIEIRPHPKVGDATSILSLFTEPKRAPPLGLSDWDAAYLKAVYHTEQNDKTQLLAVKDAVVNQLAPHSH